MTHYDNETVLVVDDDEMVRESTVGRLLHLGFQAEAADSGHDALKALEKKTYDFLLSDIEMPGMSGLELLRQAREKHPQIIMIAMTGYIKDHSNVDVSELGAIDFIKKPFDINELEARFRNAIVNRDLDHKRVRPSNLDSLTGLYNHEHFFNQLGPEVSRAKEEGRRLGLILLELDGHGYNANQDDEKLLQQVGKIIETSIRKKLDTGYRYGGIEFAIILSDADNELIDTVQKRVKAKISEDCKIDVFSGYAQYEMGLGPRDFFMKIDNLLTAAKEAAVYS